MQIGLSHLFEQRAWRIVSEDSGDRRPFLLIVRTLRFSLSPCLSTRATSTSGYSEFPAYSQVYLRNYNVWSFNHTLSRHSARSTVAVLSIVTAAVYRGFDQELRLAADPINYPSGTGQ